MIWWCSLSVVVAGGLGGALNALFSDNGFILPKREQTDGNTIVRPGVFGNALVGAVGALVSWGLYGPAAAVVVVGSSSTAAPEPQLTVGAMMGAVLVGIGGARWLSTEVDKRLFRSAAATAAGAAADERLASGKPADPGLAKKVAVGNPAEALGLIRSFAQK